MQAEAKRARADLQSAQAQPPPTAPEDLRAAAAAVRRRAAECEAHRAEAEAAGAQYTAQLELMAVQLQQAQDLQTAAREAVRRAALEPLPVTLQVWNQFLTAYAVLYWESSRLEGRSLIACTSL